MPWTETARREYRRDCLRYASDLTDREWALIEPFMPPPRRIGRPRKTDLREVVNAVLYMASTGCQWRMLAGRRTQRRVGRKQNAVGERDLHPLAELAERDHVVLAPAERAPVAPCVLDQLVRPQPVP